MKDKTTTSSTYLLRFNRNIQVPGNVRDEGYVSVEEEYTSSEGRLLPPEESDFIAKSDKPFVGQNYYEVHQRPPINPQHWWFTRGSPADIAGRVSVRVINPGKSNRRRSMQYQKCWGATYSELTAAMMSATSSAGREVMAPEVYKIRGSGPWMQRKQPGRKDRAVKTTS